MGKVLGRDRTRIEVRIWGGGRDTITGAFFSLKQEMHEGKKCFAFSTTLTNDNATWGATKPVRYNKMESHDRNLQVDPGKVSVV